MARSMLGRPTLATVQFAADLYTQLRKPAEAQAALAKLAELPLGPGVREMAMADYALRYESLEKATEHLRAAIAAAPQSDGAWHALARAQMLAGRLDAVFQTVSDGLEKVPNSIVLKRLQDRRPLLNESATIVSLQPLSLGVVSDPTNDALAEMLSAMLAFWKKPTDTSLVEVRRIADRHTREPVVQFAMVELYQALGRYEEAAAVAVRAAQSFPAAAEPPRLATQAFSAAGRWTQALGYADAWRALARGDVFDADLARGTALLQLGRAEEAIRTLAVHVPRAVQQPAEFTNYLLTYAAACARTGRTAEAESALRPLLADHERIRHGWLSVVSEFDRPADAARRVAEISEQFASSSPRTRAMVALARLRLAERINDASLRQSAFDDLVAASASPDLDPDLLNVMASSMEMANRKDLAEQLYRRSLEQAPMQPIVKNNLAMLLVMRGETSESLKLAQEAVRQLPLMGTLWDTLATVALAANQNEVAIDAWQHAIDLDSSQPGWLISLAETQLKAGRRDAAIRTVALYDTNASNDQLTDDLRRRMDVVREQLK
jgi:tetratricopeptide (TPR) repeat protein